MFNESLLTPTSAKHSSQNSNDDQAYENDEDDILEPASHDPEYFESPKWNHYIQTALDSFTVPQPSMNSQPSRQAQSSRQKKHNLLQDVIVRSGCSLLLVTCNPVQRVAWFFLVRRVA